jgi:hypothetical protein
MKHKANGAKTSMEHQKLYIRLRCITAIKDKFWGTEVSIPTPCWDGEVPPEPSPSVSIAVSAVSIDLTAISINLAVSYDEEGVVLRRG